MRDVIGKSIGKRPFVNWSVSIRNAKNISTRKNGGDFIAETYFNLDKTDKEILEETFKVPKTKWKEYDRFLDGLNSGMERASKIIDNYGITGLNEDAIHTILKNHGYEYTEVRDYLIHKKVKR